MIYTNSELAKLLTNASERQHSTCNACKRKCPSCFGIAKCCTEHHSHNAPIMIILRDPSITDALSSGTVCCNTEHHNQDTTASNLSYILNDHHINERMIYLTNAVLCGSRESNQKPSKDTIINCSKLLLDQILIIKPKIIIAMGLEATNSIYISNAMPTITKLGDHHNFGILVQISHQVGYTFSFLSTYHPAIARYRDSINRHFDYVSDQIAQWGL